MHARRSSQDVLLCDSCENVHLQSHCELCHINLCKACVGEHLSDSSKRHKVVSFKHRKSTPNYPKCPDHDEKQCELHCERCDIPVCFTCVTSGKHKGHDISDVLETINSKTQNLQNDLEELETKLYPQYEELFSDIQTEKAGLKTIYKKLTTAVYQKGDIWHQEITTIVNQLKSDIEEMKNKHLDILMKNTDDIAQRMSELKQTISDLKSMLKSDDVFLTSTYESRNSEYRTLPPKVRATLPSFSPRKINKDQLKEMFGPLSSLSLNTEHCETMESPEAVSSLPVKPMKSPKAVSSPSGKPMKSPEAVSSPSVKPMMSPEAVSSLSVKPMKSPEAVSSPSVKSMNSPEAVSSPSVKPMKSPEAVSSPPVKPLINVAQLTATLNIHYHTLRSVSCLDDKQFWTSGDDKIMKLYNVQGKLLASIQTKSWNEPRDIEVKRDGNLVYTDTIARTVNLVTNDQIQTVITLHGWTPRFVSSTSSDDLLVTMDSDDKKESKVVRYSGSTETQTIQFDDQGHPLYSFHYLKHISENRNLDICVADYEGSALVVVNKLGKLRFRYTGHFSDTEEPFHPVGITTDSQSHILTADFKNDCIHILNQDGQFLRYIQNCSLCGPFSLCVDINDNLFVAELISTKVKKIRYL